MGPKNKQELLDSQIELESYRDDMIDNAHRWYQDALEELQIQAIDAGIVSEDELLPWQYCKDEGEHQWQVDGLTHRYPWRYEKD